MTITLYTAKFLSIVESDRLDKEVRRETHKEQILNVRLKRNNPTWIVVNYNKAHTCMCIWNHSI